MSKDTNEDAFALCITITFKTFEMSLDEFETDVTTMTIKYMWKAESATKETC